MSERIKRNDILTSSAQEQFTPGRVLDIWQKLPENEILSAMLSANSKLDSATAQRVLQGEKGRLLLLGSYHSRFYGLPFNLLKDRGLMNNDTSVVELGPSMNIHYAEMDNPPKHILGIEDRQHIVSGAQIVRDTLVRQGKLPEDCRVIKGNHDTKVDPKRDISIASLLTQYGANEEGTSDWLMRNGKIGINGDVHHTASPTSRREIKSGILQIRSLVNTNLNTGIAWQLEGQSVKTKFGNMYDANLVINDKVFGPNKNADFLSINEDTYHGKVVIRDDSGDMKFHSWALEPTRADDEEIEEVYSIWKTLYDICENADKLPGISKWDSAGALALPAYSASEGRNTLMMITTALNDNLSGTIPLSIVMKNAAEASGLHKINLLTQVGPDKKFRHPGELFEATMKWMNPASGFNNKFNFFNPPLITTITTADKKTFERIKSK